MLDVVEDDTLIIKINVQTALFLSSFSYTHLHKGFTLCAYLIEMLHSSPTGEPLPWHQDTRVRIMEMSVGVEVRVTHTLTHTHGICVHNLTHTQSAGA